MIGIFCYKIPRDVSQPMYAEYSNRLTEVKYLMEHRAYSSLKPNIELIEMLLALSIFYKRVVTNLDSATKFSGTVFNSSAAEYIRIGKYKLTPLESRRIYAVVKSYRQLMVKYHIPEGVINYTETKDFLRAVKYYKRACEYREKDI
jgi:hypothetical protein